MQQLLDGIPEKMLIAAITETEFQFIKVTVKMFMGNMMISTNDSTFEKGPYAFNAVGVNVSAYPFIEAIVLEWQRCVK